MENETILQLRKECEDLGIKWHSRHSEEGLRKLIETADVGETEPLEQPVPDGKVKARVTKWGAGKISNGAGAFYDRDDTLFLTPKQAEQLDAKRYVEDFV